jgi:two-component system response regulator AtoC
MTVCGRRLLIAEDEPILRITITDALKREGWEVDVAEDGAQAMSLFERHRHDFVLSDLLMPRLDGIELLRRVKAIAPDTNVVIITAHGSIERAVEAMQLGAADFVTKPFSMMQLLLRLNNICSSKLLREENVRLQEQLEKRYSFGKIIGKSKRMLEVFELIKVVADSDSSVVVQGESGTGKEMVASAIHFNSPRRSQPYIRVSCAALPETLLESELFGFEKGAFTGASERRLGRFEAASGGTLFLDEIGELPLSFQVKLLRVLQEKQIERLGSHRPINVDVRVVSASLRPLEEEITTGRFREDLFFRINTVTIHLPPLRERREDIPILAQAFLEEFSRERGKTIEGFSDEVLEAFDAHPWPGNVRELRNVVERAALFCKRSKITLDELAASVRTAAATPRRESAQSAASLHDAVERAEIEAIKSSLAATEGRRGDAAKLLGISRKTLWEKCKQYGITDE